MVCGQSFYYRVWAGLPDSIIEGTLSINISPQGNKHNFMTLDFPLSSLKMQVYDFIDVDRNCSLYGALSPSLYQIKAIRHGEPVLLDFGKTRVISEVLIYILEQGCWDTQSKNIKETTDGWSVLQALGYSDFVPQISWWW